jgi:hypothetical protein
MVMSTTTRLSDATDDPEHLTFVAGTLTCILAQLTTINKRLDLQGESIARHRDQNDDGRSFSQNGLLHCDLHGDFHNSFHRSKLNFPPYDGAFDPLLWLNWCESFFSGTRTMAAQ